MNYWKKFASIFVDSFIAFRTNQVPVRAGGLSFSSLLAFIPFAIIFSWIANITGNMRLFTEVLPELNKSWGVNIPLENLQNLISHSQSIDLNGIGVIGIFTLFLTFLIAIGNLEKALNIIWNIHKNRNWLKRVQVYTPFFFLLGFFILVNAWILVKFKIYLNNFFYGGVTSDYKETLSFTGILFSIIGLTWLFISFTYYFIPYAKIKIRSAITGSTIITALEIAGPVTERAVSAHRDLRSGPRLPGRSHRRRLRRCRWGSSSRRRSCCRRHTARRDRRGRRRTPRRLPAGRRRSGLSPRPGGHP